MSGSRLTRWQERIPWLAIGLMAALAGFLALSWWAGGRMAAKTEAGMRQRLLRQATEIAGSINPELAKRLAFTKADVGSPAYERLRQLMTQSATRIPKCKWVYLMAARDGRIVFGPDNVKTTDPQYTPPGDDYQKPPAELKQAFVQRSAVVAGPYTDEWGCVVSAFIPVIDRYNGNVLAMVGVDILVDDWEFSQNAVRWSPPLVMLVLGSLMAIGSLAIRRRARRWGTGVLSLRSWIVGPTALAMLVGLVISGVYEYQVFVQNSRQTMASITAQTRGEWNRNLDTQIKLLKSHIDEIDANPALRQAWLKGDRTMLARQSQVIFEPLKREYGITHFYFIAPDRTCFLRMHTPERHGDSLDRYTLQTAVKTDEDAWGLELGSQGTFTLRYVRPWKLDGKTVGYLELGMELHHLVGQLVRDANIDTLSLIHKKCTTRQKFESGRRSFGFTGQWDDYPGFVVVHQTIPAIPAEVVKWFDEHQGKPESSNLFTVHQDGKRLSCGVLHLLDAAGEDVADLVVMRNVTAEMNAAWASIALELCLIIVIFCGVLALLWSITGMVERQIGTTIARLEEGEEKYRTLVGNLPAGVVVHGPDTAIQFANPMASILLGLTEDQMLGKAAIDPAWCFRREDGSKTPQAEYPVSRVLASGEPIHDQIIGVCRPDRVEPTWVLCNGYPVRDADGRLRQAVITFIDITGTRQANEQIRVAKERFQQLAEQSRNFVWEVDAEGRYTYVSDVITSVAGYAPEELIGKRHFHDLHPAEGREAFKVAALAAFARHEEFLNLENPIETKDGRIIWVSTSGMPILDANGVLLGYRGSDTDITSRKEAEEEIRQANQRFNLIAEQSRTMIWEIDKAGVYTYANPVFQTLVGYSPEELVGKLHFYDLVPSFRREAFKKIAFEMMARRESFHEHEDAIETKDGQLVWILSTGMPILDAHGDLVGYRGADTDISVRKKADLALKQKMQELERFNALTVDRELRMIELKKEINALLKAADQGEKYRIIE